MTYSEVLKILAAHDHGGKRFRRHAWPAEHPHLHRHAAGGYSREVTPEDVAADDWYDDGAEGDAKPKLKPEPRPPFHSEPPAAEHEKKPFHRSR